MWAELSGEEWDAIVTKLRVEMGGLRVELAKARQAEDFERNMAQREWLAHQDERRRWFQGVMVLWFLSGAITFAGRWL